MDFEEIKDLVQSLEKSNCKKITIKKGDFSLDIETTLAATAPLQAPLSPTNSDPVTPVEQEAVAEEQYVHSPMVGTFYSAPSPEQAAFV